MAKRNTDSFNPYHQWLGIPEKKCPPTHYELLGISLDEDDLRVINSAAERQKSHIEQYLGTEFNKDANKLISQIDEAEIVLTSPELRRDYDRKVNLFKKRRKKRQIDPTVPHSSIGSGRSVGEGSGFAREYAGIVATLAIAFLGMAAASFWLPWQKLTDSEKDPNIEIAQPEKSIKNSDEKTFDTDNQSVSKSENPETDAKPELKLEPYNNNLIFALTFDDGMISSQTIEEKELRLVQGKIDNAIKFDGKSYIEVPCTLPSDNSPRTLTAWIQNTGNSKIMNSHAIACGSDVDGKRTWGIYHANGNWTTYGWGHFLKADTDVDRNWHFHSVSYDGDTVTYFVDGKNVGENKAKLNSTTGPMVLGTYANRAMGFSFTGLIDDVRVYDIALNQLQIEDLFQSYPKINIIKSLREKLADTKWVNSNRVTFEWTNDGRFLHAGKEQNWKVLDDNKVQIIFGPEHVDTLEFSKDLTRFKQLIKGGPTSFTGRRQ